MNIDFWFGISLGMLATSGFFWAIKPKKSEEIDLEEEENFIKIKKVELEILELNNKLANLEGRFLGMRDYLREKL